MDTLDTSLNTHRLFLVQKYQRQPLAAAVKQAVDQTKADHAAVARTRSGAGEKRTGAAEQGLNRRGGGREQVARACLGK